MNTERMMIGSAQFGMNYGIANHDGQLATGEIEKILQLAAAMKINYIDTASAYGASESILGKLANPEFKIVTKLSSLDLEIDDINDHVINQCFLSLKKLQRETCEGLLVHHANDLLGPKGEQVYDALSELKKIKKIKKIGVSVYSPEQVYALLDRFKLDIVQFPLNIVDQRFIQKPLLEKMKGSGIELHARSIFLQGLLLMKNDNIPDYFKQIKPLLQTFNEECQSKGLQPRQALIEFITSIKEIDHFIVGIDNHHQFSEIVTDLLNCKTNCRIQFSQYECNDPNIINPMNWKMV